MLLKGVNLLFLQQSPSLSTHLPHRFLQPGLLLKGVNLLYDDSNIPAGQPRKSWVMRAWQQREAVAEVRRRGARRDRAGQQESGRAAAPGRRAGGGGLREWCMGAWGVGWGV